MSTEQQTQPSDMGISGTTLEGKNPDAYKYNVDYHRFSSFLGVENTKRGDRTLAQKIATIYDWAQKQVGKDDGITIMNAVRDYQKSLGVSFSGETLVNHLYRNIRLDGSGKQAKEVYKNRESVIAKERKTAVEKKEVNVEKRVQKHVAPEMQRVKKQVQDTVKKSISKSIERATIEKRVKPAIKKIEQEVKRTVESNIDRSVKEALEGIFK